MQTTHALRLILPAALFAVGCEVHAPEAGPANSTTSEIGGYGTQPNGTGVHVGSTQPASWFGLAGNAGTWYMTGFSRHSDGSYWATGAYSLVAGLVTAEASVQSAELNGQSFRVAGIHTSGSQLSIDLADAANRTLTLQHASLVGLTLLLRVPDLTGLLYTNYRFRFGSAATLTSQFGDLYGYQIDSRTEGLLGASYASYCRGPNGESIPAVFYEGSQWNPLNGARTDGTNLITMTCQNGSVARCMSWGYRPWGTSQTASGETVSLRDHHQACVHMKRASYCGDSTSSTIDGTLIVVDDTLNPQLHTGPTDIVEALWTPTGASCVSNRRHPELPFIGCPLPLPTCPANPSGGYLLRTALPAAGTLGGLLD